jgi:vacuolar protein sorting-associated protein 26
MAAYFFSSPVDVDIKLEGEELRKQVESKAEKDRPVSCPVYYDGESVSGQVRSSAFSRCGGGCASR